MVHTDREGLGELGSTSRIGDLQGVQVAGHAKLVLGDGAVNLDLDAYKRNCCKTEEL